MSAERIVDVIYATRSARRQGRYLLAVFAAIAVHAAVASFAARAEPGLWAWSAALALAVHDELAREQVVTLEEPKVVPHEPQRVALSAAMKPAPPKAAAAPAPASAGKVLTADATDDAPVDFASFVSGPGFAGGTTTADGTAQHAIAGPVQAALPDHSASVRLEAEEWSCPWPTRAASELVDEQHVVIKVLVREDGSVVEAKVVRDAPGGFADAAMQCAKRTRFLPARDKTGAIVRQWSGPIEVRFWR